MTAETTSPQSTQPTPIALTVLIEENRRDLRVPGHASIADLLRELGSSGVGYVQTTSGRRLKPDDVVEDVIEQGDVLAAFPAQGRRIVRGRRLAVVDETGRRGMVPAYWTLAVLGAVIGLTRWGAYLSSGSEDGSVMALPGLAGMPGPVVFACALGLVAMTVAARGPRAGASGNAATIAAVTLGGAAGSLTVADGGIAPVLLPLTVTFLAASAAAAVRYARTHGSPAAVGAGVLLLVTTVLGVVGAASIALGTTPLLPTAALLGICPLALRALPARSLDVPEDVLIDISVAQRTAASVREQPTPAPSRVRKESVTTAVHSAVTRRTWGAVVVSILALVTAGYLLISVDSQMLARTGFLDRVQSVSIPLVVLFVAVGFALIPRRERLGAARVGPRLVSGLLLVMLLSWGVAVGLMTSVIAIVIALVLVCSALGIASPLSSGWRSVRWSRAADGVESLTAVLAPAMGLLAGGTLAYLRLLASG